MPSTESVVPGQPMVLDLFCGAGGFSVGFEAAGYHAAAGVDADESAVETWNQNHAGHALHADLAEHTPEELQDKLGIEPGEVDVVTGGPPCQDFTKANQKVDLGRNNLVTVFAAHAAALEPQAIVMENVRQLTTKHDDVLHAACNILEDAGYEVAYRLLDAADYGVPQHRIRAFLIATRNDETPRFPAPTHGPDSPSDRPLRTAGDAIGDLPEPDDPDDYRVTSKHADKLPDIPPGMNYSFYTERMGHPNPEFGWRSRFSDFLYKADPGSPVRTLKAQPGAASGPFHWNNRRFTEEELKRLQSFPDAFEFPHGYTTVVRQIGNSVPPGQARALAECVRSQSRDVSLIEAETDLGFTSRRRTSSEEYQRKASARLEELGLVEN